MPDITMCPGGDCLKKEKCYRYTAEPSSWQSYFTEPPNDGEECEYFWQTTWTTEENNDE